MRDPSQWVMVGRGIEYQFFLTDRELDEAINVGLPAEFAPYRLIGLTPIEPRADQDAREYFECTIADATLCGPRYGTHIVWIVSLALTPETATPPLWDRESAWALSGLIQLSHGFVRKGRREESRIAITDRVRNTASDIVETNRGYHQVFTALRSDIASRLAWSTVRQLPDGTAEEDDRLRLMSDQAAMEARNSPDAWEVQPGRRVRG